MRRKFVAPVLIFAALLGTACAAAPTPGQTGQAARPAQPAQSNAPEQKTPLSSAAVPLPKPIPTGNSVEICLNSRYSDHNLTGTADDQQMANILWAAGKAPLTGAQRTIYVTTPKGQYTYDAATHSLTPSGDQRVSGGAFVIDCNSTLAFDTGVAYQLAILASVSTWKSSEPAVASCPKLSSLYFGVQNVQGLTTEAVAHSSVPQTDPTWLPDPMTDGSDKIDDVLANLNYVSKFSQDNLSLQQISQILWAGYGCTPHTTSNNRKGLTVPSAVAAYYLTGKIYLVNEKGVYRYIDRNPATDLKTRDHRIEPVNANDERAALQSAVNGLPQSPCYVVLCLGKPGVFQNQDWMLEETGFAAANILAQATAMGLGCHFETGLKPEDQVRVRQATGIPVAETPQVIISIGGLPK